jgi:SPP1 family predicted phage head-tail adaptor
VSIRAGQLRHRVTLQAPPDPEADAGQDSYGQPEGAWTEVGVYWADVRFLAGREAIAAKQVQAEATHAVTMRHGAPVTPQSRLVLEDGRKLGVISAGDPDGRGERIELVCQELVDGA